MTLRLGVQGASGRTGSLVLSVLDEYPHFILGCAAVGPVCARLGTETPSGIPYTESPDLDSTDCWVDFSTPASSISLARLCAERKQPLLIATTGHTPEQYDEIVSLASRTPILLAPNTSLGVFATKELAQLARSILGDRFQVEISEIHHRLKKDAPSGTALYLARELKGEGEDFVFDRSPRHEARRADEIGITSIRGGDVAGEHTVYFLSDGERIEIAHRAWDRKIFARGALHLLGKIVDKKPGFYALSKSLF